MSNVAEIVGAEGARAHLENADGVVVVSAIGCEPCEAIWNAFQLPCFDHLTRVKLSLSPKSREDCAFFREHKINAFPTVAVYQQGAEVKRFTGALQSDDLQQIGRWLQENLDQ